MFRRDGYAGCKWKAVCRGGFFGWAARKVFAIKSFQTFFHQTLFSPIMISQVGNN